MENKISYGVWYSTRVCFWFMIGFWIFAGIFSEVDYINYLFSFTACGLVIATFILSIIHLRRYKQKGFAITSLVISSIGTLIVLLAFLVGILIGIAEA